MRKLLPFALSLFWLINSAYAQKVLFIGNSLTYSNDLPGIVEELAKDLGEHIDSQCICLPNYGLEDHWNDGLIQGLISKNKFDYVIFQQGPSSQSYGRSSLIDYGGKISKLAIENDAKPAYFMVWPSVQYYQTFEGVIKNHTDASQLNKVLLVRGGEVWKHFHENFEKLSLYQPDQFHPSVTGSFLMALVHIKVLFPSSDLTSLKYRKFKRWISNEESFNQMIEVLTNL
ncbi:SGNH/GDSL hydrolase family protein [Roseivirga sp. E12]|uniref:SGNH/GDSL hydrolase family protein n=1 Tax=Roseivirga sp. E12 TaxID=2819237 RepID=UPI001ABBE736|nr:SGNH/GDSL hydrolase family protein [Roseivirga sp. E12]MBO3697205.1 SGNH/GDSL hydrolase family protein [Roseivirga sp. E12]